MYENVKKKTKEFREFDHPRSCRESSWHEVKEKSEKFSLKIHFFTLLFYVLPFVNFSPYIHAVNPKNDPQIDQSLD